MAYSDNIFRMNHNRNKGSPKENNTSDNLNEEEKVSSMIVRDISQVYPQNPPKEEDEKETGEVKKDEEKDEEYYKKLQEEKEEKELTELSKDMWFTKLIVQKTWIIPSISAAFMISITFLAFLLGGFELSDEHDRDYLVWSHQTVKDWDKLELAKESVNTNFPDNIQPLRTSVIQSWVTSVTFE